jgi:hypothetical protein
MRLQHQRQLPVVQPRALQPTSWHQVVELMEVLLLVRQKAELAQVERQRSAEPSAHHRLDRSWSRNQSQGRAGWQLLYLNYPQHVRLQQLEPHLQLSTTPPPTASRARAVPSVCR